MRAVDVFPHRCDRGRPNRTGGDPIALSPSPIVPHEEIERIVETLCAATSPAR